MGSGHSYDPLPEKLIDLALRSGAEAAEVLQSRSDARPVFFEANRLKQLESSEAEGTALRIWQQGRPGLAVAYGEVDPQALLDKAIALSELNPPEDPELTPASDRLYANLGESRPVEQLVDWGQELIETIRTVYPEVICEAEIQCEVETTRIINSLGLDQGYSDTTLSSYLTAEWVRGDDFLNVSDGQTQRSHLDIPALAAQIIERLDWAQTNVEGPKGRIPILFSAKAADMLWGTVQAALSGKRVLEGSSPWSDRVGDVVISPQLSLSQHPERGPFSCPFDDEGTPTEILTFIEQGELRLFYTDRTIGRELGGGSTGNGFRPGLGSYPTPGLFNLLVAPGHTDRAGLLSAMADGLWVDQMLGGGAGISGEFSINVELGYRVHRGEITGRVKDVMVAGNVYRALNQLVALGSDASWNGSCHTPSLVVDGLSVTGG
ncbi:peptidase C69 [filamentous cyanobacterium CCP5]|nr:peptidase C69 [filamentous cyanobacterium CCP5]